MSKIALLALRALQVLAGAVVIGTSAHLYGFIKEAQEICNFDNSHGYKGALNCNFYGLIPALGFNCFVGALGLLVALVGIAAAFVEAIPGIIMMAADALASLVFLAGGIALAVIINKDVYHGVTGTAVTEVKADAAFGIIGGVVSIGLVVVGFLYRRGGK